MSLGTQGHHRNFTRRLAVAEQLEISVCWTKALHVMLQCMGVMLLKGYIYQK